MGLVGDWEDLNLNPNLQKIHNKHVYERLKCVITLANKISIGKNKRWQLQHFAYT